MVKFKATIALGLTFLFLIASNIVYLQPVKAQYQGNITINSDGSISPLPAPIQQDNGVYVLTDDVVGSISVMASNLAFNGNGHSIIGLSLGHGIGGLSVGGNYYSSPPILMETSNVTVKNLIVKNSVCGISLHNTSNSLVINNTVVGTGNSYLSLDQPTAGIYVEFSGSNIITENNLLDNYEGIYFLESPNNLIVRNNVVNCSNTFSGGGGPAIVFWGASNNTIYHNNFINNPMQAYDGSFNSPFSVNNWDNGYPSGGNYWSNYDSKYPNASEFDNSGIGNTPFVIDASNIDHFPFIHQINAAAILPTPTPTVPEFPALTVLTFLSASVLATYVLVMRRRKVQSV